MSAPLPFKYVVLDEAMEVRCGACTVYAAAVSVYSPGLSLCRSCLDRMRATLKEAFKAIPRPPKTVREKHRRSEVGEVLFTGMAWIAEGHGAPLLFFSSHSATLYMENCGGGVVPVTLIRSTKNAGGE